MEKENESKSVSPLAAVIVVLVAGGVVAYLLTPSLGPHTISRNESAAVGSLKTYLAAQNIFHRAGGYDLDPPEQVYANPYTDMLETGWRGGHRDEARALKLIARSFADAHYDLPQTKPRSGYVFDDITADANGPYDYTKQCGLCAVPAKYIRTGHNIFIVDATGEVYQRDAAEVYQGLRKGDPVPPVTVWPDVEKEGWEPVGE